MEDMGALAGNLTAVAELVGTQGSNSEQILFETLQGAYFGMFI